MMIDSSVAFQPQTVQVSAGWMVTVNCCRRTLIHFYIDLPVFDNVLPIHTACAAAASCYSAYEQKKDTVKYDELTQIDAVVRH
jgi:hypothetical protein